MAQKQTPGVYIVEKNAFPNSVVEVATAIPVFIGFTEQASYQGNPLYNQAVKITSLTDYHTYFGESAMLEYVLTEQKEAAPGYLTLNGKHYSVDPVASSMYYLYNMIRMYFENNGGPAYIYSLGSYGTAGNLDMYQSALKHLENEPEPTIVIAPDALLLDNDNYNTYMQEVLTHCQKMQSRVAVFDVYNGAVTSPLDVDNSIETFRNGTGTNAMNYGISYFPWVNSTVIQSNEVSFLNLAIDDLTPYLETGNDTITSILGDVTKAKDAYKKMDESNEAATMQQVNQANQALLTASGNYTNIIKGVNAAMNTLPVAGAMAGVYAYVDDTRGVWKAPANVSLTGVVSPTVNLNDDQQANLNVDATSGKSVNVIRFFSGQGVLVWGARTLDGNSQDWRYVNVRRTMIMIEQSVKLAARAYVFEPNDANTWSTVKAMIGNFLNDLWKQGALAGTKPEDAYIVQVGLGSTMTGDDILNGYMNITVKVAITRPAEFIVITFQQQMQKS